MAGSHNGILVGIQWYTIHSAFKQRKKFCNINEIWGYYAEWNKSITERQILYDSSYRRM